MQRRVSHLIVVSGVVVVLVVALVAYAGLLTSAWGSLLACTPAVVAFTGIVAGMLCGMFFFEGEEDEAPAKAAPGDERVVHRTATPIQLGGLTR